MRITPISPLAFSLLLSLGCATAGADGAKSPAPACPAVVTKAIKNMFPTATVSKCKAEREHGQDQFEVVLVKADSGKAEVDVAADGTILQVEEKIQLDQVPAAVQKAFAAKYPKAKMDTAEKQTPTRGPATFELAFAGEKGRVEATFAEDGKFVEEE